MPKKIDLSGQVFGKLTALYPDTERKGSASSYWICKCECGNLKSVSYSNLRSGGTKSCGCLHKSKITKQLVGEHFGKLTVLKDSGKRTKSRGVIWLCQCDCGNFCEVNTNALVQGYNISCECQKRSYQEAVIEELLINNNILYKREYVFSDLKTPKGGYARFDFAIFDEQQQLSYLIEYDGEVHYEEHIGGWNTLEKIQYRQICDQLKNEYCQTHNIPLIRISYKDKDSITIDKLLLKKE